MKKKIVITIIIIIITIIVNKKKYNIYMIQASKIIGTGLATTDLMRAGVGMIVVLSGLILIIYNVQIVSGSDLFLPNLLGDNIFLGKVFMSSDYYISFVSYTAVLYYVEIIS